MLVVRVGHLAVTIGKGKRKEWYTPFPYQINKIKMKIYPRPTIKEAYKMFFQYAFLFNARSRRGEFIPIFIGNTIIFVLLAFLIIGFESEMIFYILGLIFLITLIPWVALMCRRLHDIGINSLWLLVLLLPMIGVGSYLGFLLAMAIRDSQNCKNDWGESPKYYDDEE